MTDHIVREVAITTVKDGRTTTIKMGARDVIRLGPTDELLHSERASLTELADANDLIARVHAACTDELRGAQSPAHHTPASDLARRIINMIGDPP